ncbi:MAG: hypothetical protein EOM80_15140 [Erysipelotrichia bacterium]|nr:hypothetical protein [Erysipelotrichia bacterium]
MKEKIGVWIDHRRAWVVTPAGKKGKETTTVQVESGLEEHAHIAKGLRSNILPGSMDKTSEDNHQRNMQEHLATYYDQVIEKMSDAKSIVIFGPGQAKIELKKRIRTQRPTWNTPDVEPADKMTSQEIAELVNNYKPCKTMTAE